ncbi:UDP-N-acetylmuramoyl-L-alanine--D-glutamate ligase [Candidatus Saccharibacteria bacterium]|nr:UDP-N-acetylmuramoyl-L-alanine--D-glutamate ligase [Candidatus Saccharibacteria bacterium]
MKVAIAGFGIEGQANNAYFLSQGHDITIVDERELLPTDLPYGAQAMLGPGIFEQLDGFDMVVRTAGLSPFKIKTDGKVWSGTNEFFAKCPAPIIGVTGSKGKGTTCSLIASILKAAGHTVHLVGNIGDPAIAKLESIKSNDIVVYELSSFQLWDAVRSPHVAVVLGIEPEHLDVHKSFSDYVNAKANIASHQTPKDIVVYNALNPYSIKISRESKGSRIPYQHDKAAHVADGYFWFGETKLCKTEALLLPGVHNLDNACAAITSTWKWVKDGEAIGRGLSEFSGLPHRLKFVRSVNDVAYYDDSIATTIGSVVASLRTFEQPKILILGGSDKGADYNELAKEIIQYDVPHAVLIGDEASKIEKALKKAHYETVTNLGSDTTMEAVVQTAASLAKSGEVVVLSPACASFGMFKNYVDRGDQFIAAVNHL